MHVGIHAAPGAERSGFRAVPPAVAAWQVQGGRFAHNSGMPRKASKSKPAPKKAKAAVDKGSANLRPDVLEAIERVWGNGVVELADIDMEESWFWDVKEDLSHALSRIQGARLEFQREASEERHWSDDSDDDMEFGAEEPLDRDRSYHLFFVCPEGDAFVYDDETTEFEDRAEEFEEEEEEVDFWEDPPEITVPGRGRTGWAVAVSLVAPFAVIELSGWSTFENGESSGPGVDPRSYTEKGVVIVDSEGNFRKEKGEEAYQVLASLRVKIAQILEKRKIAVLPQEEFLKKVPWLRGGEETALDGPLIVLDAFFFEAMI